MNVTATLDRLVGLISPAAGAARVRDRIRMQQMERIYAAGAVHHQHIQPNNGDYSADSVVDAAQGNLRAWARYLDENYDLAIAVLDDLVTATVGTGLQFEPQVRDRGGELHVDTNDRLRDLFLDFYAYPEATRELPGPEMERLIARTWLRDGELLIRHLEGMQPSLMHWGPVPYSLELIEPDLLPFEDLSFELGDDRIVHGVEKDQWGRPVAYHLLREHPGNTPFISGSGLAGKTHRVLAHEITHLKFTRRLRQTRGVTCFHGVVHRLDDMRDMDDSERISVRVAAAFSAAIEKDINSDFDVDDVDEGVGDRTFQMRPGVVFDRLRPGERVNTMGSDRPNPNLVAYRADQIRAIAGGTGAGYSQVSRHFDTSYAAQRAESVNNAPTRDSLAGAFCRQYGKQVYGRFAQLALAAGLLQPDRTVDPATLTAVDVRRGGGTPWVDPEADISADTMLIDARLVSRASVQRRRGIDPAAMDREIEAEEAEAAARAPDPQSNDTNDEVTDDAETQDAANAA